MSIFELRLYLPTTQSPVISGSRWAGLGGSDYALTVAAREGSEGLKSFVKMAAIWMLEEREHNRIVFKPN